MATNTNSLDHARHNDDALKHLDRSPAFLDWVVTMCFYSSLHFVRHKIFPLTLPNPNGNDITYRTFDEYAKGSKYLKIGKHEMLLDLVVQHCPEISAEYNILKDMCWTARYSDYRVDRELCNLARANQKAIKLHCDPPVGTATKVGTLK